MAILLIRHGETPGNRDRIIQFPDTPLSDRGLEQAARLGERMRSEPIRQIWVSDHARAMMTADAVQHATGAPLDIIPDLGERSLGDLRGTPYAELDFDPFAPDYAPPGGESWEVFHARVDRVWTQIEAHWHANFSPVAEGASARDASAERGHFAIVTHGLVLRSLIERRLLDEAGRRAHANEAGQVAIANTAVTVIEPDPHPGRDPKHRIELLACTAHLDAETAPRANPNVGM